MVGPRGQRRGVPSYFLKGENVCAAPRVRLRDKVKGWVPS